MLSPLTGGASASWTTSRRSRSTPKRCPPRRTYSPSPRAFRGTRRATACAISRRSAGFSVRTPIPAWSSPTGCRSDAKEIAIEVRDREGKRGPRAPGRRHEGRVHSECIRSPGNLRRAPAAQSERPGRREPVRARRPWACSVLLEATAPIRLSMEPMPRGAALEVRGDPDISISDADRARYLETAGEVYDLNRKAIEAANALADSTSSSRRRRRPWRSGSSRIDFRGDEEVEDRVVELRRRLGVGRRDPGPPPEDDVRGEITRLREAFSQRQPSRPKPRIASCRKS